MMDWEGIGLSAFTGVCKVICAFVKFILRFVTRYLLSLEYACHPISGFAVRAGKKRHFLTRRS
jgi:hypothetical protein